MTNGRNIFLTLAVVALLAAQAAAQTVVPVRVIRSQSLISAADLSVTGQSLPGAIADLAMVVGKEARVALYPGRPIRLGDIGEPAVVERNQIVRMRYLSGLLVITTEGRALDRGGIGDRVRVMNLSSRAVVVGSVTARSEIEVN